MSGMARGAYGYRRDVLMAALFVGGVFCLLACSSSSEIATLEAPVEQPSPVRYPTPVGTPLTLTVPAISSPVEPNSTAALTSTSQAVPTATLSISVGPPAVPAGQLLRLISLHMMTPTEGWATGLATLTLASGLPLPAVGDIFHTSDGGVTWNLVSPDGFSPSRVQAAHFMDTANAWIVVSTVISTTSASPTSPISPTSSSTGSVGAVPTTGAIGPTIGAVSAAMVAYHTADGGQTWQGGAPFSVAGQGPGMLDFVDDQHGWLLVDLGGSAGSEAIGILKTVDGGMTWQQVARTSGPAGQATANELPAVCDAKAISFVDASTGWVTGNCSGGSLFFYQTADGGQTWQAQAPAPPPGVAADLFSNCQCAVMPPLFVSPQFGAFAVTIADANLGTYLYVTGDGGRNWTPRDLPVSLLFAGPDFFGVNDGVIGNEQGIYLTRDGGQTWAQIGSLPVPASTLIAALDFIDADHGWVTDGQHLYATHDGSQTWITMAPIVAATAPGQSPAFAVTLGDEGKTITLQVGQRFVLELSQEYSWTVTIVDPIVVGPLVDVPVPPGAQGVYEAFRSGSTTLMASGDPLCRQVQPVCALPSRQFQLQLVVQ